MAALALAFLACALLVVNNLYVSAQNLGIDAYAYIAGLPEAAIGVFHLGNERDVG